MKEGKIRIASRSPRRLVPWLQVCVVLALMLCGTTARAEGDKEKDYSKLPGYVDFSKLGIFNEEDATVDIYLHDSLLQMVAQMAGIAEPELSDVLAKLELIRVQRFPLEKLDLDAIESKTSEMAGKLEKDGWMRAVRVREKGENVYVYFKLADSKVQGITVMAVEEHDGASFVNIVGEIDPEEVGRLGRKFNIDELDTDFHWDRQKDRRRGEH